MKNFKILQKLRLGAWFFEVSSQKERGKGTMLKSTDSTAPLRNLPFFSMMMYQIHIEQQRIYRDCREETETG